MSPVDQVWPVAWFWGGREATVQYLLRHSNALDYVVGMTLTEGLLEGAILDTIQIINQCARHEDEDCAA